MRRAWFLQISSVFFGILGSLAFAYALTTGKIALTAVLIETQPLFVVFFSLLLSRLSRDFDPEELVKEAILFKGLSLVVITLGLIYLYF